MQALEAQDAFQPSRQQLCPPPPRLAQSSWPQVQRAFSLVPKTSLGPPPHLPKAGTRLSQPWLPPARERKGYLWSPWGRPFTLGTFSYGEIRSG